MKLSNVATRRPSNSRAVGVRNNFYKQSNDPKYKGRTEFKRPRTVIKYKNQLLLTSEGVKDAVVALVRVKVAGEVYAEYYMARTYHLEWNDEEYFHERIYDSKRMPCIKKGKLIWEQVATKQYMVDGEVTTFNESEGDFDSDFDGNDVSNDFDASY